MGSPPRVLVIDDRLPDSRLGSGYSRMFDVVREISTAGYRVSVFPTIGIVGDPDVLGAFGVGVVTEPLAEHLRRRSARYEVVYHLASAQLRALRVNGPRTATRGAPLLRRGGPVPSRLEAQAQLAGTDVAREAVVQRR